MRSFENLNTNNILEYLKQCWSKKSCDKWTPENPSLGQCSVTTLIINDFYGGLILKTKVDNQWHFYNFIDDKRYDFTSEQFDFKLEYQDVESSREEAFIDTSESQYKYLKVQMYKKFLM